MLLQNAVDDLKRRVLSLSARVEQSLADAITAFRERDAELGGDDMHDPLARVAQVEKLDRVLGRIAPHRPDVVGALRIGVVVPPGLGGDHVVLGGKGKLGVAKRRVGHPQLLKGVQKKNAHTALSDIRESVEELRYYREHFLQPAASPEGTPEA